MSGIPLTSTSNAFVYCLLQIFTNKKMYSKVEESFEGESVLPKNTTHSFIQGSNSDVSIRSPAHIMLDHYKNKKKFMHVLKTPPPLPITSLVVHPLGQHDPVFSSYLSLFPSFFPAPSVFHLYPACLPAHLVQSTVHC